MLKIPLLGLTTVTMFSAVVLGAERKNKEYMVPIKKVAREIASYLDSVSLVNLSGVDIMMHWECRNELALRLTGKEAMMGQAHPIDFIRCNDEATLLERMDHYANSDKRAAIALNGHCHLVRGMPPTLDPIYDGEFSVKHRIKMNGLGKLSANPSRSGQWITYTNRDDEWVACKLNDDLEMETEIDLKKPNKRSFRIVGSNYAISQAWTKDIGGTFKLYEFSDQSGIGDLIGTVTVPPRSNPVIREAEDGGLPTIVYVNTKVDKDGKLICTVHTQSFIDGEHSSETVIHPTGTGITEFTNLLTLNGKHVITTYEADSHSDRFTVSDVVTGEIKVKGRIPLGTFIQQDWQQYGVFSEIIVNDRYCVISSEVTVFDTDNDDQRRFVLNGFFDLETGEQMGPFFKGHHPWCWASVDLLFFQDKNGKYYLRSVHSPQVKIPFQMPDQCNLDVHGCYIFPRDQDQDELLFVDWKKLH